LAEREFRLLFTGQLVSLLGTAVAPIVPAFGVLDLTHSEIDLGFVLAANWLPQLVLGRADSVGAWCEEMLARGGHLGTAR
jgi:hypothetical protein